MIAELELLREKLASRLATNRIALEAQSEDAFQILPKVEDGFPITISFREGRYEIEAGMWHGHFEKSQEASAVMCWLLTPYYRIVTSYRGGEPIATWLEIYADDGWNGTEFVYFVDPTGLESPADNADMIKILVQAIFLDSAFASYYPAAHLDQAGYPLGTILGETSYERRNDGWYPIGVPEAE